MARKAVSVPYEQAAGASPSDSNWTWGEPLRGKFRRKFRLRRQAQIAWNRQARRESHAGVCLLILEGRCVVSTVDIATYMPAQGHRSMIRCDIRDWLTADIGVSAIIITTAPEAFVAPVIIDVIGMARGFCRLGRIADWVVLAVELFYLWNLLKHIL